MKNTIEKTIEKYNEIQAIRAWNARFSTPPVCTKQWSGDDFQAWIDSRNALPPFEEWIKQ